MTTVDIKILNYGILIAFCVILGPENVYLDTTIFFLNQLETEIIKHISLAAILEKMTATIVK